MEGIVGDAGAAVAAPAAVPAAVPAAAPEPGVKFEREYLNLQLALNRMHDELHEDNLEVDKLKQVLAFFQIIRPFPLRPVLPIPRGTHQRRE
jgi:hypothetical protein